MRCPEKSIVKRKVYISITIKKLYLMFLKYKQTQKNEHAIDYIQNSSLESSITEISIRRLLLSFLLL